MSYDADDTDDFSMEKRSPMETLGFFLWWVLKIFIIAPIFLAVSFVAGVFLLTFWWSPFVYNWDQEPMMIYMGTGIGSIITHGAITWWVTNEDPREEDNLAAAGFLVALLYFFIAKETGLLSFWFP